MAMDASAMGQAVADAVSGVVPDPKAAVTPAQLADIWKAACGAIVAHITANAEVAVPALGLQSPQGPVTGNAKGRIT